MIFSRLVPQHQFLRLFISLTIMAAPALPPPDVLQTAAIHLSAAKYFQLAGYVMLVFDHMLTFGDEVERIWKRKFTGATALFLLNRYLTPVQFAIILDAFHNPKWAGETCRKYVAFEGYSTIALVAICEVIMILRIYALYNRSIPVLGFLAVVLVAQIVVGSYGIHDGFAVPLPPGFVGCIFTGETLFAALWFGPLITDVCIFVFTLWRTRTYFRSRGAGSVPTIELFVRDGIMYFMVIFMVNLLNILIYIFAVDDLKAIGASFSQLMTSVMISRLVLNLRSVGEQARNDGPTFVSQPTIKFMNRRVVKSQEESFMTRTIGDLGGDLKSGFYDVEEHEKWGDDTTRGTDIELQTSVVRAY